MQSNEPGVIVHTPRPTRRRTSRAGRRLSTAPGAPQNLLNGLRSTLHAPPNSTGDDDGRFDLDRLSYMSTALAALPGMSLRRFLVPVMRLYKQRLAQRRATRERLGGGSSPDMASRAMEKRVQEGMQNLAKALMDASREVGLADGSTLSVDPKALGLLLDGKVEPVSILADHVLTYPNEAPESQFVYILLSGNVVVTHYQPQNRPSAAAGFGGGADARTQFYTSSDEKLFLCGGGINSDGNNLFLAAAQAHEARRGANNNNPAQSNAASPHNDTASNMTSAIQRSLRNASRAVGQPTLVATRTEVLHAPAVLGASEALGFAPTRCATITAVTASSGKGDVTQYVPYVDVLRIRLADVHAALLELCSTTSGRGGVGRASVYLAESAINAQVVAAARSKTLAMYFYQNESLMRQSWLLQDTPTAAIRTLISLLRPRTYMPGEVMACPHRHSTTDRQLCFLRRGRMRIAEVTHNPPNRRSMSPPNHISTQMDPDSDQTVASRRRRTTTTGGYHAACNCTAVLAATAAATAEKAVATHGAMMLTMLQESREPASGGSVKTVGVADAGASFGELSLLFGEQRSLTLVADTACDMWYLSYNDFMACMRRDDALRRALVQKAAALRMKWLSEQRFTPALAAKLRASCELFRPLSDYVIRLIQERLEPVVYSAGTIVASTSEKCDGLTMIIHGRVVSIIEGVCAYGPGDTIGEGCLVSHRWPLGLSARTMVEGWKLKREALQDALERADQLHAHSGETTIMTPLWLKRIFAPPLPEVETDVVGRQRMPTVGAAPGGEGYPRYGRVISEVFLKALCFRYRDYVKWEDICYDTLGGTQDLASQTVSDQLSRELVVNQMQSALASARGAPRPATAPLASRWHATPAPPPARDSGVRSTSAHTKGNTSRNDAPSGRRRGTLQDVHAAMAPNADGTNTDRARQSVAAGAGMDAAKKARQHSSPLRTARSNRAPSRHKEKQRRSAGASAFLVSSDVIADPFRARQGVLMSLARGSAPKPPTARRLPAQSGSEAATKTALREPLPAHWLTAPEGSMSPAAAARWEYTLQHMQQPLPQLDALSAVLEERDRLYATEQLHELTAEQQQIQRENQVRERLQALQASSAVATTASPGRQVDKRMGSAPAVATATSAVPLPPPPPLPPVHLFLSDPENPRAELTVAEAIAIGYVLQLPSQDHIQSSVSAADPDVSLGLPSHRARRRAMALTPNDRHNRRNFLFASASFTEASESMSRYQERKSQAQEQQAKARRLLDMLHAANDDHTRSTRAQRKQKKKNGTPDGKYAPEGEDGRDESDMGPVQTDSFVAEDEPAAVAPMEADARRMMDRDDSLTAPLSPQISAGFFISPERDRASGGSTPSPFRGSPGRAAQKREEGYMRLLSRDPVKALDMLYHHYHLSWAPTMSMETSPLARTPASPAKGTGLINRLKRAVQSTAEPMPGLNFDHPELIFASGRDRRSCAAYLSAHTSSGTAVADVVHGVSSPMSAAAAAMTPPLSPSQQHSTSMRLAMPITAATPSAAGALETATGAIDAAIHAPEAVLFVDGYGALKPEPASVRHHMLLTLPLDPLLIPQPTHGTDRRLSMAGHRASARPSLAGAGAASPGTSLFSQVARRPQDLVMPDADEAGQFMRRMQRDVFGLNAIAEEHAKAREAQRHLEPRLARRAERVEAALSIHTPEEDQVVQDWQRAYHVQSRDPLAVVRVPDALLREAGTNYLAREMERMQRDGGAAMASTGRHNAHANVVAWQDQVSGPSASLHASPHGMTNGRHDSSPSGHSAHRVVASIGTKQLGYASAPLVSPAQNLSDKDYQAWVAQREKLFASYSQQRNRPGSSEDTISANPRYFVQPTTHSAS